MAFEPLFTQAGCSTTDDRLPVDNGLPAFDIRLVGQRDAHQHDRPDLAAAPILARRWWWKDVTLQVEPAALHSGQAVRRPSHASPKPGIARLEIGNPAGGLARLLRIQREVIEVHKDTGEIGIRLAGVEVRRDPVARLAVNDLRDTRPDMRESAQG